MTYALTLYFIFTTPATGCEQDFGFGRRAGGLKQKRLFEFVEEVSRDVLNLMEAEGRRKINIVNLSILCKC